MLDEIDEIKQKKKRLASDISELTKSADEYAQKSEDAGQLNLGAKSNSLRRTVQDKMSSKLDDAVKKLKH